MNGNNYKIISVIAIKLTAIESLHPINKEKGYGYIAHTVILITTICRSALLSSSEVNYNPGIVVSLLHCGADQNKQ
jgi:hypothetical protein